MSETSDLTLRPIVLIPARMASTRLPGKPLADIAGRPMVVRVLEKAAEAGFRRIAVACAEEEIAAAVRCALRPSCSWTRRGDRACCGSPLRRCGRGARR